MHAAVQKTPLRLPTEIAAILAKAPSWHMPTSREDLVARALGGDPNADQYEVAYDVPGKGRVVEATVARCRNGLAVNYADPYMRRRDPDCMVVADDRPTDQTTFAERFPVPFADVRTAVHA
ncbi:MAG: hypothetical protein RLZZ127_1984, partial [Planctomycetota bacterium]